MMQINNGCLLPNQCQRDNRHLNIEWRHLKCGYFAGWAEKDRHKELSNKWKYNRGHIIYQPRICKDILDGQVNGKRGRKRPHAREDFIKMTAGGLRLKQMEYHSMASHGERTHERPVLQRHHWMAMGTKISCWYGYLWSSFCNDSTWSLAMDSLCS